MRETIKILSTLIFINFFILGCIDKDAATTSAFIEGECSLNTDYITINEPIRLPSTELDAQSTVILLHGENASPLSTDINTLANDFNYDGYNVIIPYMGWSSTQWSGTFCESISYLNYLIVTESLRTSQDIILAGHSLGGTVALAYTAMSNTVKPAALNILAPSHFIHQSTILADAHADSIALAKLMLENNQSDEIGTFQTYSNGALVTIATTPEIYLSFHDVDEFPNIESTAQLIRAPTLWLAGDADPLTSLAISFGIIDLIPNSETYKELSGDHYTFLPHVSDAFKNWYNDWYNGL